MRKKIKFPLIFKDNQPVRTMEELREFADVDKLYLYFMNGKLSTWLQDRDYLREAEQIQAVDKEDPELPAKLCKILELSVPERTDCRISKNIKAVRHQYEKLNILKQVMYCLLYTSTQEEALDKALEIAKIIQTRFDSWDSYNQSYLAGYNAWRGDSGAPREPYLEELKASQHNPFAIDWNLELEKSW